MSNLKDENTDTFIEMLPVVAFVIDTNLKIKNFNNLFSKLLMKVDNIIDTDISLYPFDNLNQYIKHLDLLKNRDTNIIDIFEVQGTKKKVQFFVQENTKLKKFVIVGIDLTNELFRVEAQEEARQQNEMSSRLILLGQMAAGVAHEINNPLAIISGFLSNMKKNVHDSDEISDKNYLLDRINRSKICIERISTTVKGLKFLTNNDVDSDLVIVDVNKIIENALDLCLVQFKVNGIRLIVDDSKDELFVKCRPTQLIQVLLNLLINSFEALEFSQVKWVKISTSFDTKNIIISITDSGANISPEVKSKMMQPFFTTKTMSKNIGIGLSSARMIMDENFAELLFDENANNTKFDIKFNRVL